MVCVSVQRVWRVVYTSSTLTSLLLPSYLLATNSTHTHLTRHPKNNRCWQDSDCRGGSSSHTCSRSACDLHNTPEGPFQPETAGGSGTLWQQQVRRGGCWWGVMILEHTSACVVVRLVSLRCAAVELSRALAHTGSASVTCTHGFH